jgi:molybdopterin synthase sulfur carrier subunit
MSIKFRTHPSLRRLLQNREEVEVIGTTVGECIQNLDREYPGFKKEILNSKGQVRNIFEIYINSDSAYPDELNRPVKDGDLITIISWIAGG